MSSPPLGMALAPCGLCIAGFGSPATTDPPLGKILLKSDGQQASARKINSYLQDYEIDSTTGRTVGMNEVQQQVYLALATVKGSAASINVGSRVSRIQTKGDGFDLKVENEVRAALQSLLTTKRIILHSVEVIDDSSLNRTQARIHVRWSDVRAGELQTTII